MKLSDFDYELPKELIAQTPIEKRDHSKMLVLDKISGKIEDKHFYDIVNYLWENDVLVLNKTKVFKARLKWKIFKNIELNENSSNLEILINLKNIQIDEKFSDCEIFLHKNISWNLWECLIYPWKKLKIGTFFCVWNKLFWQIKDVTEEWRKVEFYFEWNDFFWIIDQIWETPTPPYIKEKLQDDSRYQTVFSEEIWSVAAPTAWLHFTEELLDKLAKKWVKIEFVLLHVWLWTFKWIETENILDHKMHSEFIAIDKQTSEKLNDYKKSGKRIISVGTTSTRTLESFANNEWILEFWQKETNLFIYPWYRWKFIDGMITNFHLPKSSLIVLVSALAWRENILNAYSHAIDEKYRFFSFGDAMFIK